MTVTDRCKSCAYYCTESHQIAPSCDYILYTGHRRGCPAGNQCNKYRQARGRTEVRDPNLGTRRIPASNDQLMELYWQGKTDEEIAAEVGVNPKTIARWRKGQGLLSQIELRKKVWDED